MFCSQLLCGKIELWKLKIPCHEGVVVNFLAHSDGELPLGIHALCSFQSQLSYVTNRILQKWHVSLLGKVISDITALPYSWITGSEKREPPCYTKTLIYRSTWWRNEDSSNSQHEPFWEQVLQLRSSLQMNAASFDVLTIISWKNPRQSIQLIHSYTCDPNNS